MGKFVEDWDAQIMPIRSKYLDAMFSDKLDLACHFLDMMHGTLPPKARISDFKRFHFDKTHPVQSELEQAMYDYCMFWAGTIETAISTHRDKMLRELNA